MPPAERPECYEHVIRLRAVRRFRATPISDQDVTAILEAGRWTGSARNRQAWAFVVARTPEDVARMAEGGRPSNVLEGAPLTVALVRLPEGIDFDLGRAAQNMMLAAAARGIDSCPVTLHDQERAVEVLGIPADHEARRAIAFGYRDDAAEAEERARRRASGMGGRKPLAELVYEGRFGG